eukprot:361456-Chlamydomonas_euryale.AAC.3
MDRCPLCACMDVRFAPAWASTSCLHGRALRACMDVRFQRAWMCASRVHGCLPQRGSRGRCITTRLNVECRCHKGVAVAATNWLQPLPQTGCSRCHKGVAAAATNWLQPSLERTQLQSRCRGAASGCRGAACTHESRLHSRKPPALMKAACTHESRLHS